MKLKQLAVAAVCFSLWGCASLFTPQSAEQQVEQRVQGMMAAFMVSDYATAYSYMSPGYRETHNLNSFISDFNGLTAVVDYSIHELSCEEDRCEVLLVRQQKAPPAFLGTRDKPMIVPINSQQSWVLIKGKWFYYKR